MRILVLLCFLLAVCPLHAAEACRTIRGRAHYFDGDANLRIWHIGTHHDFTPADSASWDRVMHWLQEGVRPVDKHSAAPESEVYLFADFQICPTEPFKKGSVQKAKILSATHRRYVPAEEIVKQKQGRSPNR